MKLIEVMFKLDTPLAEWENDLFAVWRVVHVQTKVNGPPSRVWVTFLVPDDHEVPEVEVLGRTSDGTVDG